MPVTAKLRYLRIAPRKVREVADLIRGKEVGKAQTQLEFLVKKSAKPVLKLLKSAVAQARHNFQLDQSNLYISKILVDEGPKLKRWRAASRGRVSPIMKRTSHITIILDEIEKKKRKRIKAAKPKIEEKAEKEKRVTEKLPKERPEGEQVPSGTSKLPTRQAKFKPEKEIKKPKKEIGLKRIFKRKSF